MSKPQDSAELIATFAPKGKLDMEIEKFHKKAVLVGANELIGRKCLLQLLQHEAYSKIHLLMEEPLNFEHPKLEVFQINFEHLSRYTELLQVDDVYYCWDGSMKIKHDPGKYKPEQTYAYELAKLAYEAGIKQYVYLSSIAADPDNVLYYRHEKQQLEHSIAQIPFWALHIFRPAFLLEDDQASKGIRLVKNLANRLNNMTSGGLDKYQPVSALGLAKLMIKQAQRFRPGIHIYSSEFIKQNISTNEKGLSKKDGKSS